MASTNTWTALKGYHLTPSGWVHGTLVIYQGKIDSILGEPIADKDVLHDLSTPRYLPGFIDLHIHGGGGCDVMDSGNVIQTITSTHVRFGTTSLLATTMTAPTSDLVRAFEALAAHPSKGSRVLGVHLEGPFINEEKLGAQPDFTRPIDVKLITQLHQIFPIKIITLAPELLDSTGLIESSSKVIAQLLVLGIHVQLGHSKASYEQGLSALNLGAQGFTHLFNAMSGLHHRAPGLVGAALAHAQYAEIIPDLIHLHAGAIKVALRCIPKSYCVTDATAATAMPDGSYRLGSQTIHKCTNGVRLADGTLAGSTLTMDVAFRNLIELGLNAREASLRTSTYAADFLQLPELGRLLPGCWGDVIALDQSWGIKAVWVAGKQIM